MFNEGFYSSPVGQYTFHDYPSFYLVASGNININSNVTSAQGIFVAEPNSNDLPTGGGIISTCTNPASTTYPSNEYTQATLWGGCAQPIPPTYTNGGLNIDGAMMANQVRLARAGGDISTGAAEDFTYNPNVWIVDPFTVPVSSGGAGGASPSYTSLQALAPVL
jgi:hypothetical protein